MHKLAPELLYLIQHQADPALREDAVFVIGEWAWMCDLGVVTQQHAHDSMPVAQELSFFATSVLSYLLLQDPDEHVRVAAAQALGNFVAIAAARYAVLEQQNVQHQQYQPQYHHHHNDHQYQHHYMPHHHGTVATGSRHGLSMFGMTLRMQLQNVCAALCKCLQQERVLLVHRESLFCMLRLSHSIHAVDCESQNLLGTLRHLARFSPCASVQALALATLHRMQTYQSLRTLSDLLMHRRWSVLGDEAAQT